MTDVIFGNPVRQGEIVPGDRHIFLVRVTLDGTRRIVPIRYQVGEAEIKARLEAGSVIPAELEGYIALGPGSRITPGSTPAIFDMGVWVTMADEMGRCFHSYTPTTPGDDFYRFRNHVGQAADHFDSRFVPAKLNQRRATDHRLFEVAQELTPEDRDKVGNVSLKERSDNGALWRLIHEFRTMPHGTAALDALWRAERDRIDILLREHCDRCARIIDVALDHPHEEWKGYLDKQIRFNVGTDGAPDVIQDSHWLTPEVVTNDIANYNAAGRFFRRGFDDDDYLPTPRSAPIDPPIGQATVPRFSGANSFRRTEMIAHWRKEIADLRASSRGSDFQKRMFYWFAASNILALYRDENNDPAGLGYLELNRRTVRSTDVIGDDGGLTTLGEALYRHYYPDLQSLSDTPWFLRARLFLAPASIILTVPGNLLTIPDSELSEGAWVAADRARWAATLNDMMGFTVLPTS